ncbi:5992_t:CDS:2 [Funneliformis geosporum]|nr:5992_t:CDS:2 [Funneliformis geosporum]
MLITTINRSEFEIFHSLDFHKKKIFDLDNCYDSELVFILENGTEPTPVRAIRRPEPQLHAPVHVPFPPAINAADLIRTNKSGSLLARCTNKFLIYRNEFAKEVRTQGHNLSMSEVSCLAAQAWKQEPNYVIRKYADIAHEVKWLHKQLSRSNSRNRRRISSDSSSRPAPSVDEQTIYTTQQKGANLLTQQFPTEMLRLNDLQYQQQTFQQQHNDMSPLISPLSPLTPTMFSPSFMYQPRLPEVVTSDITVPSNEMMFSPPLMDAAYKIPVGYCNETFTMSPNWIYGNQQYQQPYLHNSACATRKSYVINLRKGSNSDNGFMTEI